MNRELWEPLSDADRTRRLLPEWAATYHVRFQGEDHQKRVSEYEWAYHYLNNPMPPVGRPDTPAYDRFEDMQGRAERLYHDLLMGATDEERKLLYKRYLETGWVHNRLFS